MPVTFPGESPEYRAARDHLLEQELELRRATEAVAQARRALPPGGVVPAGYVFEGLDAAGTPQRMDFPALFSPKHDTLAVYSFMFGPERKDACPMCSGLLGGLDGVADHLAQRLELVIVAESPLPRLLDFAKERGWKRLRFVSATDSRYNRDYHGKGTKGGDTTMLNLFHRDGGAGGVVRHTWGSEVFYAKADPGQDDRGLDTINPIYNMLDLTPEGRGDFYTKLRYG